MKDNTANDMKDYTENTEDNTTGDMKGSIENMESNTADDMKDTECQMIESTFRITVNSNFVSFKLRK
jgi:hypothetical protein